MKKQQLSIWEVPQSTIVEQEHKVFDEGILLMKKPAQTLDAFLSNYSKFQKIDILESKELIKVRFKLNKKGASIIEKGGILYIHLEEKWYDSLQKGEPSYDVYDDDFYYVELWVCWVLCSRQVLLDLIKCKVLKYQEPIISFLNPTSVVDLGCGIGYSTAALTQLFPKAKIYGTNLENTKQYMFCKFMSAQYGFTTVSDIPQIPSPVDLVFASEYFEHIESPLEHLREILTITQPKYLILNNTFNTKGIGHFVTYKDGEKRIDQKHISKAFNRELIKAGYQKIKTNVWNNRPTIWVNTQYPFLQSLI